MELKAKVVVTKIQIRLVSVENQWLSATEKSTFLHSDLLKRQLEHARVISKRFSTLVASRTDELIKADTEIARHEATHAHPLLRDLAEQNAALAEQRELISIINRANIAEQQELNSQLESIESSRKKLDEHLTAAGHSQAVGLLLRFERSKLPQTSRSQQRVFEIESTLPDLKLKRLDINEQWDQLSDQQTEIEQLVAALDPSQSVVSAAELSAKASELLEKKRNFLFDLNTEYETYLNGLARLQQSHRLFATKRDKSGSVGSCLAADSTPCFIAAGAGCVHGIVVVVIL